LRGSDLVIGKNTLAAPDDSGFDNMLGRGQRLQKNLSGLWVLERKSTGEVFGG
jgi:hypothetical protein